MLLGDDQPLIRIRRAWVTWALLLLCAGMFALQAVSEAPVERLALHPADLLVHPDEAGTLVRLLGHALLHGDVWHLLGNLLALFVFGNNVEDAFGHARFVALWLWGTVVAAAAQVLLGPGGEVLLVGASGAIAAVMGAYLLLYPRAVLYVLAFGRWPALVPAAWFVMGWFLMNLLHALQGSMEAEVAYWAHIGGFVAGMAFALLAHPADVPLLQNRAPWRAPDQGPWRLYRRIALNLGPSERHPAGFAQEEAVLVAAKAAAFVGLALLSAWF